MNRLLLSTHEIDEIKLLLKHITSEHPSVESESFLNDVCLYAHDLPLRVRRFLNDFRLLEASGGVSVISGYPIDDQRIGPTPAHWQDRSAASKTLEEEVLIMLFGALLGEALGWSTQQNGHIVHDVLPIRAHEMEQLGTGSKQVLYWHNEDAFHPYRGDYLCLMCLRNPDRVATTYASIDMVELSEAQKKLLFERNYTIRPDESHLDKNRGKPGAEAPEVSPVLAAAYEHIHRMNNNPERLAVLFGHPRSPYVRVDPYFMEPVDDQGSQSALDSLVAALELKLRRIVLEPGDCLFIDNYKAVHGRQSFTARYDGQDRWLKRINITRDLRKSRDARLDCNSRIIY